LFCCFLIALLAQGTCCCDVGETSAKQRQRCSCDWNGPEQCRSRATAGESFPFLADHPLGDYPTAHGTPVKYGDAIIAAIPEELCEDDGLRGLLRRLVVCDVKRRETLAASGTCGPKAEERDVRIQKRGSDFYCEGKTEHEKKEGQGGHNWQLGTKGNARETQWR
jgi:hypothetical protein